VRQTAIIPKTKNPKESIHPGLGQGLKGEGGAKEKTIYGARLRFRKETVEDLRSSPKTRRKQDVRIKTPPGFQPVELVNDGVFAGGERSNA